MALLQGSSYYLEVKICEIDNNSIEKVKKAQFTIGNLEKLYISGEEKDITWDSEKECFIVFLSQEETFEMEKSVKWQFRVKFIDGQVDGTIPKNEYVYDSLKKVVL